MLSPKRRRLYGFLLAWAGILPSCASRSAVPPAAPPANRPAAPLPEKQPPAPPPADRPATAPRPIERFARRVKDNDPSLVKYFTQDGESRITVHAAAGGFEATYDLPNARPSPGGFPGRPRWELDFSVRETASGELLRDTLYWTISPGDSGILLALDDDYQAQWREYFGLFDRYGAKVTFFVTGGCSPFCAEALDRGHDIGYHTMNHLNLPKVSRETFFAETLGEVEHFRQAGVPLRAFAYPFGLSEPWMREALAGAFSVQRGFGVRYQLYNRAALKTGYIASISIDNIIYKTDAEFDAALTMMLRTVKFIDGDFMVPLTTHTIDESADWGISPRRLEYLLRSAGDLKLRFYRYGDF
jgi:hypothetical protein